jgi:hypothetical protein
LTALANPAAGQLNFVLLHILKLVISGIKFCVGNLSEMDLTEIRWEGVDWLQLAWPCEPSGSIKREEFLDWVCDC